jgi:hypothetical protein
MNSYVSQRTEVVLTGDGFVHLSSVPVQRRHRSRGAPAGGLWLRINTCEQSELIESPDCLWMDQDHGFHALAARAGASRAETRTPTYWVLCGRHHRFAFASARFNYALPAIHGFLSALVSYPPDVSGVPSVSALLPTAHWAGFRSYGYGSSILRHPDRRSHQMIHRISWVIDPARM